MRFDDDLELRAARHGALGDPWRLAVVDQLAVSDRSPSELQRRLGLPSNLLAPRLDVLEDVGLVSRSASSGDGRRRYVRLARDAFDVLTIGRAVRSGPALFVCTANSARSQLAAALWTQITDAPATSAGTHPAAHVHPGAVAAAERAGLDLTAAMPSRLDADDGAGIAVTVCDRAHEELDPPESWLHWSVADPVLIGTRRAFDATVVELRRRIMAVRAA